MKLTKKEILKALNWNSNETKIIYGSKLITDNEICYVVKHNNEEVVVCKNIDGRIYIEK